MLRTILFYSNLPGVSFSVVTDVLACPFHRRFCHSCAQQNALIIYVFPAFHVEWSSHVRSDEPWVKQLHKYKYVCLRVDISMMIIGDASGIT